MRLLAAYGIPPPADLPEAGGGAGICPEAGLSVQAGPSVPRRARLSRGGPNYPEASLQESLEIKDPQNKVHT
ncbi:hypothetical protein T484DRAFT_1984002, partial [Baffinella frigidus]